MFQYFADAARVPWANWTPAVSALAISAFVAAWLRPALLKSYAPYSSTTLAVLVASALASIVVHVPPDPSFVIDFAEAPAQTRQP
jgi:hypothetical protein